VSNKTDRRGHRARIEVPDEKSLRHLIDGERLRMTDVAEIYGVSTCTLARWMRLYGIKPAGRQSACPDRETLEALYVSCTAQEIADRYGVKRVTVTKWLEKYKLTYGKTTTHNTALRDIEGFKRDYTRMTAKELAGKYGLAESTVGSWGRKLGLTGKKRRGPRQQEVGEQSAQPEV